MVFVRVDQREVQRLGGLCAKYPASYIVAGMLRSVGAVRVLDVTYGQGRFYKIYRPKVLVGADPNVWSWVVKPDVFIPYPVWSVGKILRSLGLESFDCLVLDPPWGERHHKRPLYSDLISFGFSGTIIDYAFGIAEEFNIPFVLLHYNKIIEREGWVRVRTVEFLYVSRYLNNPDLDRVTYFILYERYSKR